MARVHPHKRRCAGAAVQILVAAANRKIGVRAQQVIQQEWGVGLIRSWNTAGWFELPQRLGNQLGKLVGAKDGEVVVTDTTSVNLFKVLAAALRKQQAAAPHKRVIVSERRNFPTDLYIAQGLIDQLHAHGAPAYELRLIDAPEELAHALKEDVAVLMLTHVNYQTGYMYDMAATTAQAHQHGAVDIGKTIHPHPTLGESIGMAAEVAHGSCTDVPPARK